MNIRKKIINFAIATKEKLIPSNRGFSLSSPEIKFNLIFLICVAINFIVLVFLHHLFLFILVFSHLRTIRKAAGSTNSKSYIMLSNRSRIAS